MRSRPQSDGDRSRLRRQVQPLGRAVVAFAAGAGVGGLAVHRLHFWAITLPLVAVVVCAVRESAGASRRFDAGGPAVVPVPAGGDDAGVPTGGAPTRRRPDPGHVHAGPRE